MFGDDFTRNFGAAIAIAGTYAISWLLNFSSWIDHTSVDPWPQTLAVVIWCQLATALFIWYPRQVVWLLPQLPFIFRGVHDIWEQLACGAMGLQSCIR